MSTKTDELIRKLANTEPMYTSGIGDVVCFFCGAFEKDKNGNVVHADDCLWLAAKEKHEYGERIKAKFKK